MARPIHRGARSANDAASSWKCTNSKCLRENHSYKGRLFDVPKLFCACGRRFRGMFKFCHKDVEINRHRIIRIAKHQIGPTCVAFAYTAALEIKKQVNKLKKKKDPNLIPGLDPLNLWANLEKKFSVKLVSQMTGIQLLVHLGLIIIQKGVKEVGGQKYYKTSDVSTIKSNDYQAMFNALADGEPLVASIYVGKGFRKLKWCQIYKPPSPKKCREKNKKVIGHAVVFIGGGMINGRIFFYFLNSRKEFCVRFFTQQPNWNGVGKVRAYGLQKNVMLLSSQDDAGRSLREENDPSAQISAYNRALVNPQPEVIREFDFSESDNDKVENEESHATEIYNDQSSAADVQNVYGDAPVNPLEEYPTAEAEQEKFDVEGHDQRDAGPQEHEFQLPRGSHQNQQGGGRGRRSCQNGHGGGGGYQGGAGGYQNGRGGGGSCYNDDGGSYQQRNFNNRGRGGRFGGKWYNQGGGQQGVGYQGSGYQGEGQQWGGNQGGGYQGGGQQGGGCQGGGGGGSYYNDDGGSYQQRNFNNRGRGGCSGGKRYNYQGGGQQGYQGGGYQGGGQQWGGNQGGSYQGGGQQGGGYQWQAGSSRDNSYNNQGGGQQGVLR